VEAGGGARSFGAEGNERLPHATRRHEAGDVPGVRSVFLPTRITPEWAQSTVAAVVVVGVWLLMMWWWNTGYLYRRQSWN